GMTTWEPGAPVALDGALIVTRAEPILRFALFIVVATTPPLSMADTQDSGVVVAPEAAIWNCTQATSPEPTSGVDPWRWISTMPRMVVFEVNVNLLAYVVR